MARHDLGTIRGTIEIDYDGAGIVRAVRDTKKAKDELGGMDNAVKKILTTFGKFSKGAGIVAAGALAIHSSLQLVAATLAVIGPLAAAGLSTLPGLMAAAGVAAGILKIGLVGVGDALKAAGGDAEKFNEAIKNLSPEAQSFARAWRSAGQALKPIQQAIQDALFERLGPVLAGVVPKIASLRAQAEGVAGAINQVARQTIAWGTSDQSIEDIRLIMSGVNDVLIRIRSSVGPVVSAFINLAARSSEFSGILGDRVNGALIKLANFINQIDVGKLFERAMPLAQGFGEFLRNLGTILSGLLQVFNVDGANAIGILAQLTGRLADFLKSAQGQEALHALGTALAAISDNAGQVFLALLQAIGPILVALSPAIVTLANQLGTLLVGSIRELTPLLEALARFLSANMTWVGPLAIAIVGLAAAYKTYNAAVDAWEKIEKLAAILRLKSVGTWIANTAAIVANRIAILAHAAATAATRIPILAATAAQWLWNASLYGFPLVWIIAAIVAVIAIVLLLVKHWDDVVKFFGKAWDWLQDIFSTGLSFIKNLWNATWQGIISYLQFVVNTWVSIFTGTWALIRNLFQGGINFIRNLVQLWLLGLQIAANGIREVLSRVGQFFGELKNAVIQRLQEMISTVKSLPGRIVSALGNMGRLLYNKGRELVQGFINGLRDMIGRVKSAASDIIHAVTNFLPGSPAKEGPLSGQGYVLLRARRMMADLARGIQQAQDLPVGAMLGAIHPVSIAASTGLSGASTTVSNTTVNHGGSVSVGQLILRGIIDPTNPASTRRVVAELHAAIETYKKEYA